MAEQVDLCLLLCSCYKSISPSPNPAGRGKQVLTGYAQFRRSSAPPSAR
jgi:hypothetical protein